MSAAWPTLDGGPPRIIAHRGASGVFPEHTLPAFEQAVLVGADLLEPDLVMTADRVLMVRHDRELARSTVMSTTRTHQRSQPDALRVDDLRRDELRDLRAIQPFAQRDRSFDGQFELLDFAELLRWSQRLSDQRGAPIWLYPELKHATALAGLGLDPVSAFIADVTGCEGAMQRLWLQCFEIEPLQRIRQQLPLPVFLLLDEDADWAQALDQHASALDGLAIAKSLLQPACKGESSIVDQVHARGLRLHAWTYRDDLPASGFASVQQELDLAFALGVDALFCDFPATAIAHRSDFAVRHGLPI